MERLIEENLNTPQEYARIYQERQAKGVNWADDRRWNKLLERFTGGNLIDLGCLDSKVPERAKDLFPDAEVHALDFVPEVLAIRVEERPDIFWKEGDVYDNGYPDDFFSYVVLGEVIEHLERPAEAIAEAVRILRPGGTLALSTPLNEAIEPGAVDGHRHLYSFEEKDIRAMLEPYGSVDIEVLRSQHEPEYRYCFPQLVAFLTKK